MDWVRSVAQTKGLQWVQKKAPELAAKKFVRETGKDLVDENMADFLDFAIEFGFAVYNMNPLPLAAKPVLFAA